MQTLIQAAIKEQVECTQLGLQILQNQANRNGLDDLHEERLEELNEVEARFKAGELFVG